MSHIFVAGLERLFEKTFLESAPLYRAAPKVRLPADARGNTAVFYRGTLSDFERRVDTIADFDTWKEYPGDLEIEERVIKLARNAGILVDGLIRIENLRQEAADYREVKNVRVADIFQFQDRPNFWMNLVKTAPASVGDPNVTHGWVAYKFYFAVANLTTAYKKK